MSAVDFRVPTVEEIREAEKKKVVVRMLTVYADDSSDGSNERVFAVGGVACHQHEWDEFKPKWLQRTKGKIFHATDCESDQGDFRGVPHAQNKELYKRLTNLLASSTIMGFGIAIDLKGYRRFMGDPYGDAEYFYCFAPVVSYFIRYAALRKQQVRFIFDINHKVKSNAAFLYENFMCRLPEYKQYVDMINDDLGYSTSRSFGIQVADLFTYETMKRLDNEIGPVKRQLRKSLKRLYDTKRFECRFARADYWEGASKRFKNLTDQADQDYEAWRLRFKGPHNIETQIRHLIYKESQKD